MIPKRRENSRENAMSDERQKILGEAQAFMEAEHGADTSGHGSLHIRRVVRNAERILASEPDADGFVVRLGAILHDVDDKKVAGGAEPKVPAWLAGHVAEESTRQAVLYIIDNISFKGRLDFPELETIEAKIVSDADKLDYGATGIARVFAYGGKLGRPDFDPSIFPKKMSAEEYRAGGNSTGINHFFEKILHLRNMMQTAEGRRMAEERHRFTVEFLRQFFAENDAPEWIGLLKEFE
jgi:uncharacterized protein